MSLFPQMSESELLVMEIVWRANGNITSAQIIEQLEPDTGWKPSTVWTFLGRLVDKGFLRAERSGKRSFYFPNLSKEEYRQAQTKAFLQTVHGGSVKSFFAALSGDNELNAEELEELKTWLLRETGGDKP
ncbi:MAG: BlaI/MecI/CopY family transcriptional regulator [Oscillospiraceae bacterium]|nr:BlaI/MecI/CopY family transcriptional regulator [Oscillospiraceae bacterium]